LSGRPRTLILWIATSLGITLELATLHRCWGHARAVWDGRQDGVINYRVGHGYPSLMLDVSCEAKLWDRGIEAISVKPMMRRTSRLKHRDVAVFITTSFSNEIVREELLDDGHPVFLVAGGDVAGIPIGKGIGEASLERWLQADPRHKGRSLIGPLRSRQTPFPRAAQSMLRIPAGSAKTCPYQLVVRRGTLGDLGQRSPRA